MCSISARLGYYLTLASIFTLLCWARAEPSPVFHAFKEFLTNRPPIKECEFELSMNRFWEPDKIKPSWPAFVPVRGAIQDRGFYLQFPTIYPWRLRVVYGVSSSNYWSVDDHSVGFAAMEGAPGASPNNADEIRAHRMKARLEGILLLGIEDAVPGSLGFTSETNFVAQINRDSGGVLEGTFILDAAGVPIKAEYHDKRSSAELQCNVLYVYSPQNPAFPPLQVISYRQQKGELKTYTNIINKVQIGFDKAASNGYKADMFLTPTTATRDIYIWSNGLRYRATHGQLVVDMGTPLPERAKRVAKSIHQEQEQRGKRASTRIIVAVLLIAPAIFLSFKLWKREKQTNDHHS